MLKERMKGEAHAEARRTRRGEGGVFFWRVICVNVTR